ncbi:UPF0545 protein C22orf39 homolog isoform X3 [Monodelphis domestica]|uniref:UPF0545 protein C22orf39 homolog isoform X3 n=1 Tax=Monodelphis domestica TaxID=13616 RepID=UPI0004431463|nr:UPF0545 protein C22orf39 homolog isoform X3 [Monodelphis domestica]
MRWWQQEWQWGRQPPRSCEDYWAEWKHCRTIRNFLHHYYTYGESPACDQWKRDYKNCQQWEESRSPDAKQLLCQSEQARILAKQKHPPVWTLRQNPPRDWHLPLPEEEKSKQAGSPRKVCGAPSTAPSTLHPPVRPSQ